MRDLRKRVVVITGAAGGIGRALSLAFARRGSVLALVDLDGAGLDQVRQAVVELGAQASVHVANVGDRQALERVRDEVLAAHGRVDVLINNAGVGLDAPLMSGTTEHWRAMLELNVLAPCICTREAIADMRKRGDEGHVIHIASMASHRVPPGSGVYSASKFALRSLTEGLRLELRDAGSDIRVTAISPGYVETEFAQNYAHGDAEQARATYSRFPVLQPGDIADMVAYALRAPAHVQIHDLLVRPTRQPS